MTRKQGWIKNVDVILPKSWSLEKCYSNKGIISSRPPIRAKIDVSIGETHNSTICIWNVHLSAYICILISWFIFVGQKNTYFGNTPWVEQFGECGQQGSKLHLPASFLDDLRGSSTRKSSSLLKSLCKYRFGIYEEDGFLHDELYPSAYVDGNITIPNRSCKSDVGFKSLPQEPFCQLGTVYDRYAPSKQNLLCSGSSVLETVLNHQDFRVRHHNFN